MFKRRTLTSALMAATLLVATSAFAQFAERTIKFTTPASSSFLLK